MVHSIRLCLRYTAADCTLFQLLITYGLQMVADQPHAVPKLPQLIVRKHKRILHWVLSPLPHPRSYMLGLLLSVPAHGHMHIKPTSFGMTKMPSFLVSSASSLCNTSMPDVTFLQHHKAHRITCMCFWSATEK